MTPAKLLSVLCFLSLDLTDNTLLRLETATPLRATKEPLQASSLFGVVGGVEIAGSTLEAAYYAPTPPPRLTHDPPFSIFHPFPRLPIELCEKILRAPSHLKPSTSISTSRTTVQLL